MTTLRELIDSDAVNDPPASDATVLTWLNGVVTVQNDATNGDVLSWAAGNDAISRLRAFSAGSNATQRSLADAALVRIQAGLGLSLSQAPIQALLSALVTATMFTQAEIDALNATAQVQVERWKVEPLTLNNQPVTSMSIGWVGAAR